MKIFNTEYRKLNQDEKIPKGAFHSLDEGVSAYPLVNPDTIGQTPNDFSKDRSFWVPVKMDFQAMETNYLVIEKSLTFFNFRTNRDHSGSESIEDEKEFQEKLDYLKNLYNLEDHQIEVISNVQG